MASKAYEIAFKLGAKMDKSYGSTFDKAESIASKTVTTIKRTLAGLAAVVISFSAVQGAVDEAMKFESAMADVAKVVDGLKDETGKTTEAYAVMSDEILDMTARLPMAAEDITKLIAAAGQSGIAADELTRFAEDAAKMGVAFDLPAERAGELAAVIRSSLGMTQDEFVTLADKINYFGNNSAQSADKIIEVVEATGLIGQQAGVSADQIAAMSAAMNGAMDSSSMGTALSNIYSSLMKGSGATANAQKAWASLGFTSEQVAKSMLEDSQGTMTEIFAAMNNLPAEQLSSTIGSIFGDNKSTKMAIASFTANLDQLESNFQSIGDATVYAGSMQDEFNARAETTENKIKLAENAINRLKIGIGDLLLPAVAQGANLFADAIEAIRQKIPALTEKLQGLQPTIDNLKRLFTVLSSAATSVGNTILSSFTGEEVAAVDAFGSGLDVLISIVNSLTDGIALVAEFVQNNWSVIAPIVMGITSALIAYKAAMIGVTVATKAALIIEALTKAWAVGSTLIAIFTSGAKAAAIAQWALNAAMTANPIGVVVVAIGALIALIALLVMNWDTVKAKAIEVWQTILSTLGNIGTWFQGVFAQAQGAFQNFMGNLSERFPLLASIISVPIEAIKGYIAGLQQFLGGIIDFVTGVFTGNWSQAWQGIQDIFAGAFSALVSLAKAPLNAVISLINSAISGLNSVNITMPDWMGGKSFGINIPQIPMLAKGSQNAPDTFIAGEQGPELITGAAGSKVFTADQTSGIFNRLAQLPDMAMDKLSGAFGNLFNSPDNISRYDNLNRMQDDSSPLVLPSGSESYNSSSLEVNYSIGNITIQGGGENIPNIKQQIKDALRENSEEIVQLINDTIEGNEHRRLRLSNS